MKKLTVLVVVLILFSLSTFALGSAKPNDSLKNGTTPTKACMKGQTGQRGELDDALLKGRFDASDDHKTSRFEASKVSTNK